MSAVQLDIRSFLEGTLIPNSPYPALQPQVVRGLLRRHARCINMWLTYDKIFSIMQYQSLKQKQRRL